MLLHNFSKIKENFALPILKCHPLSERKPILSIMEKFSNIIPPTFFRSTLTRTSITLLNPTTTPKLVVGVNLDEPNVEDPLGGSNLTGVWVSHEIFKSLFLSSNLAFSVLYTVKLISWSLE